MKRIKVNHIKPGGIRMKTLGDYEVKDARIKDMDLGVLINYGDYEYLNKMEVKDEFR